MNELPIVILSKELKYSLASEKIKTLEKAIDYLPKLSAQEEQKKRVIQQLSNKYAKIKQEVSAKFHLFSNSNLEKNNDSREGNINLKKKKQADHSLNISQTQPMIINTDKGTSFYNFLLNKCICEVYGSKGSGKTSILLHFAQQYVSLHSGRASARVVFLNCAGGLTQKRVEKLNLLKQQGHRIQYLEIGFLQQLLKIVQTIANELKNEKVKSSPKIILCIDMMVLLLMPKQKPKIFLTKLFQILCELALNFGISIVYTNLTQHKYEFANEQIYNHASYYCQPISQYLKYKIYLEKPEKNFYKYRMLNLKGNARIEAQFQINEYGAKVYPNEDINQQLEEKNQ